MRRGVVVGAPFAIGGLSRAGASIKSSRGNGEAGRSKDLRHEYAVVAQDFSPAHPADRS